MAGWRIRCYGGIGLMGGDDVTGGRYVPQRGPSLGERRVLRIGARSNTGALHGGGARWAARTTEWLVVRVSRTVWMRPMEQTQGNVD